MASIFTSSGLEILVDDSDHEELSKFSWCIAGDGYAGRSEWTNGRWISVSMHRILMDLKPGDKRKVDHINGNRLDNRRGNLRICTDAQNQRNRGKNKNNTSGFKGVTWSKNRKKWYAHIGFGGRDYFLGFYATPEAAHQAYCEAAAKHHGEFAKFE